MVSPCLNPRLVRHTTAWAECPCPLGPHCHCKKCNGDHCAVCPAVCRSCGQRSRF